MSEINEAELNTPERRKLEEEVGRTLQLEINQAINRALSKLDNKPSLQCILVPLAVNTSGVLKRWEQSGGEPFEENLGRFMFIASSLKDHVNYGL